MMDSPRLPTKNFEKQTSKTRFSTHMVVAVSYCHSAFANNCWPFFRCWGRRRTRCTWTGRWTTTRCTTTTWPSQNERSSTDASQSETSRSLKSLNILYLSNDSLFRGQLIRTLFTFTWRRIKVKIVTKTNISNIILIDYIRLDGIKTSSRILQSF